MLDSCKWSGLVFSCICK
uniref:Uncharacterized protein n=1 Tax=Anguilla anguilla TaxID=7936 RepID=A0A0E9XTU2_ANGAN